MENESGSVGRMKLNKDHVIGLLAGFLLCGVLMILLTQFTVSSSQADSQGTMYELWEERHYIQQWKTFSTPKKKISEYPTLEEATRMANSIAFWDSKLLQKGTPVLTSDSKGLYHYATKIDIYHEGSHVESFNGIKE